MSISFQKIGKKGRILLLAVLSLTLLASTACVYFNTFYNAENYFESAQSQPLRDNGRPTPRAIQDYDKVIDRCVYILREHGDSRWADNALFLMARSIYYKRQNLLQARERFNDLLRVFPESEFIPKAQIYIARIDYEMNQKDDAHRRLTELLENESYRDHHSRILLLKSRYYLQDEEYTRAQQYLHLIIDNFQRSNEYEEAYYSLGISYLDTGNYLESIGIFRELLRTRSARRTKFNSRYQIALSHFYLENYTESLTVLERLRREEYEIAQIPRIDVLIARCRVGLGDYSEAESLFLTIIENNPRTLTAAEACFYVAEMYFLHLGRYEDAIIYYNRIQTESRNSPYVLEGVSRSAVVSRIIQFSQADRSISVSELIDQQLNLAEYYLYEMNLPDSALSVYSNIVSQEQELKIRRDSLSTYVNRLPEPGYPEEPSEFIPEHEAELNEQSREPDEELSGPSREYGLNDWDYPDYPITDIRLDNGLTDEFPQQDSASVKKETEATEVEDDPRSRLSRLDEDLALYREEIVPYAYFASAYVWHQVKTNTERAEEILSLMRENYPDNRYTYAIDSMLRGEKITLATQRELELERRYEDAIGTLDNNPQATVNSLRELFVELSKTEEDTTRTLSTRLESIKQKTIYSLGYVNYFHLADSVEAKRYFDQLLEKYESSEYSVSVNTFYRDNHFIVDKALPDIEQEPEETGPDDVGVPPEQEERTLPMLEDQLYYYGLEDVIRVDSPVDSVSTEIQEDLDTGDSDVPPDSDFPPDPNVPPDSDVPPDPETPVDFPEIESPEID